MTEFDFKGRRNRLYEKMRDGDVFIIFSGANDVIRILPQDYGRASKNFYYLTGLEELELAFMAVCTNGQISETLFIQAQSEMERFYMGKTRDEAFYREKTGIMDIDSRSNMESRLSLTAFTDSIRRLCIACPNKTMLERPTQEAMFVEKMKNSFPHVEVKDFNYEILCMRQKKDAKEVEAIQKAVDLTGLAIRAAMQKVRPGMTEGQLGAICDFTVRMEGADRISEAVVAAGGNATILHYDGHQGVFAGGELALVDLCVKNRCYHSDITRVFPVNGRFTERQAFWYRICLTAQEMIVSRMKPGANLRECGEEARAYVAEALIREGYIRDAAELPAMIGQARKDYVTVTGVNHSIGLEADETGCRSHFQELQPGMVYTVEPGIYLGSESLGIRIEDDYLVTEDGVCCLSSGIPKTVEEIEAAMGR